MTEQTTHSVLQRLLRAARPPVDAGPVTPSRALRLSVARAAEAAAGLQVAVRDIVDEVMGLDDMLALLDPQAMLLELTEDQLIAGLAAIDTQARAAVIEMQLLGRLRPAPAEVRPVTGTDAALVLPWIAALLKDLDSTTVDTALAGWTAGYATGGIVASARAAGMALPEGTFRVVRLTLALGDGGRQGLVLIALPASRAAAPAAAAPARPEWSHLMERAVLAAPSDLRAVLHRLRLPLGAVERFAVGQVLPLHGVTVSSLRIEGPDGRSVARARLGQVAGMRAARIEVAMPIQMAEIGGAAPVRRYPMAPIGGMVGYDPDAQADHGYGLGDDGPAMMGAIEEGMGGGMAGGMAGESGFPMMPMALAFDGTGDAAAEEEPGQGDMDGYSFVQPAGVVPISFDD